VHKPINLYKQFKTKQKYQQMKKKSKKRRYSIIHDDHHTRKKGLKEIEKYTNKETRECDRDIIKHNKTQQKLAN